MVKEVMDKYLYCGIEGTKAIIPTDDFFKLNDVEVMQLYCYISSYNEGKKAAIRFNPDIEDEMKSKFGYIYEHKDIYTISVSNGYNKDFVTIK